MSCWADVRWLRCPRSHPTHAKGLSTCERREGQSDYIMGKIEKKSRRACNSRLSKLNESYAIVSEHSKSLRDMVGLV